MRLWLHSSLALRANSVSQAACLGCVQLAQQALCTVMQSSWLWAAWAAANQLMSPALLCHLTEVSQNSDTFLACASTAPPALQVQMFSTAFISCPQAQHYTRVSLTPSILTILHVIFIMLV